ncbi:MAG: MFS transporter [Burkholderiaceae bacterium]
MNKSTSFLLNFAHALDHLFLLIFATAVSAIALDFGIGRWEDLMPYTTGAFVMFGLASVPAGQLGDKWGRRRMMLVFFYGMGISSMLIALAQTPLQMAAWLTLMGVFSSIYHPVGIPLLVQNSKTPGRTIGLNGLSGNMGIALAALSTGFLVKYFGWRMAFMVPGVVSLLCGYWFSKSAPPEQSAPAKKTASQIHLPKHLAIRTFIVMVASATTGSLLFNFTTNGNSQLLTERLEGLINDPALLGILLALIYAIASFAQLIVGWLLDRVAVKPLLIGILITQVIVFYLAAQTSGWVWYGMAIVYMVSVFAAIPFNETMVVRYIDNSMRSRVSGVRIAVSFGISSFAVFMMGPFIKASGFTSLMFVMSAIAAVSALIVLWLPGQEALKEAMQ